MSDDAYAWQDRLWASFRHNGYKGLLKAPTGAGKTIAACKVINMYREEYPLSKVWVVVPSRLLIDQWHDVLAKNELDDVVVYHYATASLRLEDYYMGVEEDNTPDLLICDEAHLLNSPTGTLWKNVINYSIPHILGLSATPSGAENLIGGTILEVDWSQCNISDSINKLVIFTPNESDMEKYRKATNSMRRYQNEYNPHANFYNDMVYRNLVMRRKGVLRNIKKRQDIALYYVKENLGKRMIVFFSTKKQITSFEKILKKEGIEYAVQVSGREEINDFNYETGTKNILLCINMLEEGYDDPTLEVGIMVSFDNSVRRNKQRCGRLIRPYGDKVAEIYYLIAEGTTDEEIIESKNTIFPRELQGWLDTMSEDIGMRIDEIYDAIRFHEAELEMLKEERNKLCAESIQQGSYLTATGREIRHRTRTTRNINIEMFKLTDREIYNRLVDEGKVTFPARVVKDLDESKPYITLSTIEYYEVRE